MYKQTRYRKKSKIQISCTQLEKKYIEVCAKKAGLRVSRYLHGILLQSYSKTPKTLPPETRSLVSELMRLAGLLHPFQRKRLDGDELNALERAEVRDVIRQVQSVIQQLKNPQL